MKPIDFVKDNNLAHFKFFRQGIFYYHVRKNNIFLEWYQFQVPITDLGDATINDEEKAITLMRYIRKGIEDGTMVKI